MAVKLKSFDWSKQSTLTTSAKADYPWNEWFDGDIWELEQGSPDDGGDFETHPLMMERIIRTRATGRRAKVQLRHIGVNGDQVGKIVLQRTDIDGPNEAKAKSRREKSAATRAANKAAKTPAKASKAKAAPAKVTAKRPAKPTTAAVKTPSKRAPRKLQAVG